MTKLLPPREVVIKPVPNPTAKGTKILISVLDRIKIYAMENKSSNDA